MHMNKGGDGFTIFDSAGNQTDATVQQSITKLIGFLAGIFLYWIFGCADIEEDADKDKKKGDK